MTTSCLTSSEIETALGRLSSWEAINDGSAIHRTFLFADFAEAFSFMTQVALAAEKMDHHPEWFNVWRTVDVTLSTHSAGGLTRLDFALANRMDEIASRFLAAAALNS